MHCIRAGLLLTLIASTLDAQVERVSLDGREIAIYNLAGRLRVEGGSGDKVVVEVTRGGRDASKLKLQTGDVRGRQALRVIYPEDRIHYSDSRWNGRATFTISDNGTFGDDHGDRSGDRRRIEVSSRDGGLDAHADLHVIVPKGKSIILRQGVGETTVENVDGDITLDVSSSHTRVAHIHGKLNVDTGSGGVEITDVTGELTLDSGSGGATVEGIRGSHLQLDIGSGSLRARSIDVSDIKADVGSGGARLDGVKAARVRIEAGSGGAELELLSTPDDVSIETGSGGVTLRVPASTSAAVDIQTGSGSIDSEFDVKVTRTERHALRGTIGSGKGRIRIESGSGSVRLGRS